MNFPADKSERTGILLLSYGGPSSIEEIEPFLKSITGLPKVPESYYKSVREKYEIIGGRSPFKDITFAQKKALADLLGEKFHVEVGFRHSSPSIKDGINSLLRSGVHRIVGLCLTPHYSTLSCGEYIKTARACIDELRATIPAHFVNSWHKRKDYISLLNKRIKVATENMKGRICILFTAHSLPVDRMPVDDPYVVQLRETIDLVKEEFSHDFGVKLAFQSRRQGREQWLVPDILEELQRIHQENFDSVVVVPMSFVSDHLETLYDIDIILKERARELGLNLTRTPSFNTEPDFIILMKNIIFDFMLEFGK